MGDHRYGHGRPTYLGHGCPIELDFALELDFIELYFKNIAFAYFSKLMHHLGQIG